MADSLCPLAAWAHDAPHAPALITDAFTWSAAAFDREVAHTCASLHALGIRARSRVAFVAEKSPHTLLALLALLRLKATACLLSPREPLSQHREFSTSCSATHWIDPATLPKPKRPNNGATIDEQCIATMLRTSGSSGAPKVACHTFAQHQLSAQGAAPALGYAQGSRLLLSLPLFHVGGLALFFRALCCRATAILTEHSLNEALAHFAITHASLVPTQLYRWLQEKNTSPATAFLLGGAHASDTLLKRAQEAGIRAFHSYGLTEMSSLVTLASHPCCTEVGYPLPHRELKLSPSGEILVRGGTLFSGYWDPQTRTPHLPLANGWFATKDLGAWTDQGLCYIGRKDRQFISGGENIQPEEIERALLAIEGIVDAVVLPTPDEEFGHRPMAYVQDAVPERDPQALSERLQDVLPRFKIPRKILSLPTSGGMKIRYSELALFNK